MLLKIWLAISFLFFALPLFAGQNSLKYDSLYPRYMEVCGSSQFEEKDGVVDGNGFGHAVLYVKGACLDKSSGYQRVNNCEGKKPSSREDGVGFSVNPAFTNVNWVGFPGKSFFYHGRLRPGQKVNREARLAIVNEVKAKGYYKGIEVAEYFKDHLKPGQTLEEALVEEAVGSDYALTLARRLICARVPLTSELLDHVIGFMNQLNDQAALTKDGFSWSALYNNCAHTPFNALASVHFIPPKQTDTLTVLQVFNLGIPNNAPLEIVGRAISSPHTDMVELFKDNYFRETVLKFGFTPQRHGVLLRFYDGQPNNDIYVIHENFDTLEVLFKPLQGLLSRASVTSKYVSIEENLNYFENSYQTALNGIKSWETYRMRPHRDYQVVYHPDFQPFIEKYKSILNQSLDDVQQQLSQTAKVK